MATTNRLSHDPRYKALISAAREMLDHHTDPMRDPHQRSRLSRVNHLLQKAVREPPALAATDTPLGEY